MRTDKIFFRFVLGASAAVWLILVFGCDWSHTRLSARSAPTEVADPVSLMHLAMKTGDFAAADKYAAAVLIAHPNDPNLLTDVAIVTGLNNRRRDAAYLLVDAAEASNFAPASRVDFAVRSLVEIGELYAAMDVLEKSIKAHPEFDQQRRVLLGFLDKTQRYDLAESYFLQTIRARSFDFPLLVTFTDASSRGFSADTIDSILTLNPSDLRVRLGQAVKFLVQRDANAAGKILDEILSRHPDFAPAHALYGQVLVAQLRFIDIPAWVEKCPPESRLFPLYWLTIGDWADEQQQLPEAARGYWEATRIDPNLSQAWMRLSQVLRAMISNRSNHAATVTNDQLEDVDRRIAELLELRNRFYEFSAGNRQRQRDAASVALSLMKLGRNWEAEAWAAAATTLTEAPEKNLEPLRRKILEQLKSDQSWQSHSGHLEFAIDLSHCPIASARTLSSIQDARAVTKSVVATVDHIRLAQESAAWGLANAGANNFAGVDTHAMPLIRSTGVGGGAVDYDLDGLPDVLLMAAGGTMLKQDSMPNELLRNLGNRFTNVTANTAVGDKGYGQGVTVGDFNEDGFPDLFFANLGLNRLFRNNGDGTFTDSSNLLQTTDPECFTTSGAFVDFNADGISDLIVTNYCEISPAIGEPCKDDHGSIGPCLPLEFPAKNDQCFIANGEGPLIDSTAQWMPQRSPGRGLGIVAGALDGKQLGIFIANDLSANLYYSLAEDMKTFVESAAAKGVAVDSLSNAQASMGIAASDFDLDGDLDFYVTGFAGEHNVLYEQVNAGLWTDATNRLDLVKPTLPMVGFGTQAIDVDNDGIDEIMVTNGHVGAFNDAGSSPYEQPLQIFRRGQDGRFELVDDDSWGNYFSTPHVGRALWTLDVNRDGHLDLMITHMSEAVSLLVNRGTDNNHWISFRLIGTRNSRDATGAVMRFTVNGQNRALWCLSGDGYFCSNERLVRAGLGTANKIESVTVTWQDGTVDKIGALNANAQYVIVQGEGKAF